MIEAIAVVDATSLEGSSILKTFSCRPKKYRVRAIASDLHTARVQELAKQYPTVEWVLGRLGDVDSLNLAFSHVDIVFGSNVAANLGKNMVGAATSQGVKHLVYCGRNRKDVEQYILPSNKRIACYFIYPSFYFQNYLQQGAVSWDKDSKQVVFSYLDDNSAQPYVDVEQDLGNAVECVLKNRGKCQGKVVPLAVDSYTGSQIAEAYTRATGIPARYTTTTNNPETAIDMSPFAAPDDANFIMAHVSKHFNILDDFWSRNVTFRPPNFD